MNVAFLFPGQGAHYVGMLHHLPAHSAISATVKEASDILGRDLYAMDADAALASTVNVQLSLFIAGVAALRALDTEGARPDLVLGLSIGAFGAAVASGAIEFQTALPFVQLRGRLMEMAYPSGYGLSVILGLDEHQASTLIERTYTPEEPIFIAGVNAPRQIVIAGSDTGMARVCAEAIASGARRADRLPIRVPSHCSLLAQVACQLTAAISDLPFQAQRIPYIGNCRARLLALPSEIRDDLATNIAFPLRWHDMTRVACELGVKLFIELLPGRILTDLLAATAFPDIRTIALENSRIDSIAFLVRRAMTQP